MNLREVVAAALAEDLGPLGDLTGALLPSQASVETVIVPRGDGVLAGTNPAAETFAQVDPRVSVRWTASDGDVVGAGAPVGRVAGPLRSVLTAERTALNFLGHLSGVATLTRRYVDAAAGRAAIRDTRKTTPGLRALEKAAVRAGGGVNHRGSLSDGVLVKDNHLGGMSIEEAVAAARHLWPGRTVQVECDDVDQLKQALSAGADLVLLDNMSPDEVRAAVDLVRGRCLVEVSGGVTLDTVAAYAATGADLIAVGALTHSAPVLDMGLDLEGV
ncbi:MAG TPA: carboxylating nicotinate-nucleotide diphosphorylase [Acidimicrobiales bacterium]|nr:carboxylating nicotinate-nucleotide diphosphorylase [Acidimicrobiales bacterium]